MDVKILNPFLEATIDVARNMAQLEIKVGKPSLKVGDIASGDVTGFIKLDGSRHRGSLAITFNSEALMLVYERMLGETLQALDDSAMDLAGEITNMVCGGAKQRLSENGYDFSLTQPSMLSGESHHIHHQGKGPVLALPLELEKGQMMIEVCLNR
jgi:chemotaxis protein CheX